MGAQLLQVRLFEKARRDRGLGAVGAAMLAQALAGPVEFQLHVADQVDVGLGKEGLFVVTLVQHDGEPGPEPGDLGLGRGRLLQELGIAVAHDIHRAVLAVVDLPDAGQAEDSAGPVVPAVAVAGAVVLLAGRFVAGRIAVLVVGGVAGPDVDHVDLFDLVGGQEIFLGHPVGPQEAAQGLRQRVSGMIAVLSG